MRVAIIALLLVSCGGDDDNPSTDTGNALTLGLSTVHYTAATTLTSAAQPVTIVGRPATLRPATGLLAAALSTTTVDGVVGMDGSFWVQLDAAAGDRITLTYRAGSETASASLVLDDALDTLLPPSIQATGPPFITAAGANLAIDIGGLSDISPPAVALNDANGAVLFLADVTTGEIEGVSGDRICAFNLDQSLASPLFCQTAP